MTTDVTTELDRAYQELRGIDSEIAVLSGRSQQDRNNSRRRIVVDSVSDSAHGHGYNGNERRVFETGGHRRIVVTTQNNSLDNGYNRKRTRYGEVEEGDESDFRQGVKTSVASYEPPLKRTLQSSVVMPTIETKSRAEILTEIKKSEKKEDTVRNRRLFSNLVVGTLKQFQKEERTVNNKVQAQTDKQREIERRLELTEKENRDQLMKEKKELIMRRREKEKEIMTLKREKAIVKYAEEKEHHFRRLQCFIQTQTKPPIFFLPAKHTLRTLELLKESAKKIEGLIVVSKEETARELQRDRAANGGGSEAESDLDEDISVGIKSAVVAITNNNRTNEANDVTKPVLSTNVKTEPTQKKGQGKINDSKKNGISSPKSRKGVSDTSVEESVTSENKLAASSPHIDVGIPDSQDHSNEADNGKESKLTAEKNKSRSVSPALSESSSGSSNTGSSSSGSDSESGTSSSNSGANNDDDGGVEQNDESGDEKGVEDAAKDPISPSTNGDNAENSGKKAKDDDDE